MQREIVEHQQSEEALRKSEERYRFLVENAPVGILTVDAAGQIADVNSKLVDLLGLPSAVDARGIRVLNVPVLVDSGITADIFGCFGSGSAKIGGRRLRAQTLCSRKNRRGSQERAG